MPFIRKRQRTRPWNKRRRKAGEYGKSPNNFHNSPVWRALSHRMRREQPWCPICERNYATMTDHIVSISAGGAPLDPDNLLPMCDEPCHNIKRGLEARAGGKPLIDVEDGDGGLIPCDKQDIIDLMKRALEDYEDKKLYE